MFYVEIRDVDGTPERHPRRPAQGQARHAQGADGRTAARRHARDAGRPAAERHPLDRADARRHADVEQRLRGRRSCAAASRWPAPTPRERKAFGQPLAQLPLHADTLAGLEAETWGAFLMTFLLVELNGRARAQRDRRPAARAAAAADPAHQADHRQAGGGGGDRGDRELRRRRLRRGHRPAAAAARHARAADLGGHHQRARRSTRCCAATCTRGWRR